MGDFNDAFMRNNPAVQARAKAQNRANVMQLKLIGQSHPTGLTANLLKLFEPRPPLEYKPPPEKRKCPSYTGMAQFVSNFAEPGDPEYAPPVPEVETPSERRARIHKIRLEEGAKKAAEELEKYDPSSDPNVTGDPYKTLFVARLNYETTESRVKREFEAFGPIKRVRLVTDKTNNKPRGYAFIEYVHTRDMKAAYKQADGKKIDNRRVLVDVERGRTVPNWRPRRLGGGLGTTRVGNEDVNSLEEQHLALRSREHEMTGTGIGRSPMKGCEIGTERNLVSVLMIGHVNVKEMINIIGNARELGKEKKIVVEIGIETVNVIGHVTVSEAKTEIVIVTVSEIATVRGIRKGVGMKVMWTRVVGVLVIENMIMSMLNQNMSEKGMVTKKGIMIMQNLKMIMDIMTIMITTKVEGTMRIQMFKVVMIVIKMPVVVMIVMIKWKRIIMPMTMGHLRQKKGTEITSVPIGHILVNMTTDGEYASVCVAVEEMVY